VLNHVGLKRLIDLPAQYLSAGQRSASGLRGSSSATAALAAGRTSILARCGGAPAGRELIGEHCDDGGIAIVATHETLGLDATRFFLGHVMTAFRALAHSRHAACLPRGRRRQPARLHFSRWFRPLFRSASARI
jgi:hypothetical protein